MSNTIICPCGFSFKKDYIETTQIGSMEGSSFYFWKCERCGQQFYEKIKPMIEIK